MPDWFGSSKDKKERLFVSMMLQSPETRKRFVGSCRQHFREFCQKLQNLNDRNNKFGTRPERVRGSKRVRRHGV